jgi:biopolymer transport protein ExbD
MRFGGQDALCVRKARLSLTPMIDVVFLLLVFFMVGMRFIELDTKVEANLPQQGLADRDRPPQNEIWVLVNVKPGTSDQPQIVVDRVPMRDWAEVRQSFRRLARIPGAVQTPVLLSPEPEAHHGWVVRTMGILNELGYANICFRR